MPLFEWDLLTQWHKIWSPKKPRDSTLSYSETRSLSHLGLVWYWVVTDKTDSQMGGWTDRIMIASMRLALHAVVHKNDQLNKNWK